MSKEFENWVKNTNPQLNYYNVSAKPLVESGWNAARDEIIKILKKKKCRVDIDNFDEYYINIDAIQEIEKL